MKFIIKTFVLISLFSLQSKAQTVLNTSFESSDNYSIASVNNVSNWKVTSGNGEIVNDAGYTRTGSQALKLTANATTLQVDNIAYASNAAALAGDVYIDFYIKLKSLPTAGLAITGYDLGTNTHRSFMVEFLSSGKIKIYDGTSGWSTQPTYNTDAWTRITIKIDNSSGQYCTHPTGLWHNHAKSGQGKIPAE
ncbi:MAG: hypothetical protein H6Q20_4 [Bacteroidetes bacterium]|nr:hypothetical protein [Bacteroidota bacterium]